MPPRPRRLRTELTQVLKSHFGDVKQLIEQMICGAIGNLKRISFLFSLSKISPSSTDQSLVKINLLLYPLVLHTDSKKECSGKQRKAKPF